MKSPLFSKPFRRYLGDLSGGQLLKKAAIRGMKLPADGSGQGRPASPSIAQHRPVGRAP